MITYASLSYQGSREINEDFVKERIEDGNMLFILADGLGGHSKGEVASCLVATSIAEQFDFAAKDPEKEIAKRIMAAQEALLEEQKKENQPDGMKTTGVVLLLKNEQVYMAHVGDSRGYIFLKNGEFTRTIDHSIPQLLVLSGAIEEKEIRNHPERSSLLRVIGSPWERQEYEFEETVPLEQVKALLLCSDGFWELIDEKKMKRCMFGAKTAEQWLNRMKKVVEKNGIGKDMDNYSAIAVLNR